MFSFYTVAKSKKEKKVILNHSCVDYLCSQSTTFHFSFLTFTLTTLAAFCELLAVT